MSRRGGAVFWPTVFAVPAFAMLVGLGIWQVQRHHWKADLLAKIAARATAAPVSVADAVDRWRADGDVEYLRVRAAGVYDHDNERHLYQIGHAGPGWHVYTPLRLAGDMILWVNRGYVPLTQKTPSQRPQSRVPGQVAVTGLLRAPGRQTPFTPDNDGVANEWFWRDLDGMTASLGASDVGVLPFFLEAEAHGDPGEIPSDGVTRLDLPDRHFGYAMTWFGLALTLVVVYVPFVRGRLRRDDSRSQPR